jgi:Transposase IS116/IS110/IS902 family
VQIGPRVPGAARLHLADGIGLLRPEEQVFTAMLEGWRNQQLARNLALATITAWERAARAFTAHADAFPWLWSATLLDEWLGDLRAVRWLRRSTLRGYQEAIRMLCLYLTDPAYGWAAECETRFGTHPVQVVHEWNTAVHVQQAEGDPVKRAFTIDELQAFFDHADSEVARIRATGRKGWLPAFRDATLFKIAYGYGLRRNETRMLDVADFGTNPHAPEFGEHGVCYVRHGKAMKGSAPQLQTIVNDIVPGLIERRGIGPVSAAQAIVSFSHPGRCRNDAAFAALAGASPLPASSGRTVRHRLNRGGDRALNRALHTIAMTRMRSCPTTQAYVARRTAEGKNPKEIRRCLKRYIARELYRTLNTAMTPPAETT